MYDDIPYVRAETNCKNGNFTGKKTNDEKIRYFLPSDSSFVPSIYRLEYYYSSLKEITVSAMLNWLKKQ